MDDDATIVLTYPGTTAVIQASWAWAHDTKEIDLHTKRGSIHAGKWNDLTAREENRSPASIRPPTLPAALTDEWTYLRHIVRGKCEIDPLSSLAYNVVVAEILAAGRGRGEELQDEARGPSQASGATSSVRPRK